MADASTPLLAEQRCAEHPGEDQPKKPTCKDAVGENDKDGWRLQEQTRWRLAAAYYSFVVVGAWDGSYGTMVIYLREHYSLDYFAVSFALLAPVVGYAIAAFVNNLVHDRFGQRGVAIVASSCHTIAALAVAQRPSYTLVVSILAIAGLGNGIADAAWNSWIGSMPRGNGYMGLLHGFYGVGAALAPLVTTVMIESVGMKWYQVYRLLGLASLLELCTSMPAFWACNAAHYRSRGQQEHEGGPGSVLQAFRYPATWIISVFVFLYAGIEISVADWISSFLIDVRGFDRFSGNVVTFVYWAGLTAGRVIVGFLASRMSWGAMTVTGCALLCLGTCGIFILLESKPILSGAAIFLLGFFLGPMFPEAVVMQAKVLPKQLHLAAIGFAVAFGSAGGSFWPFIVGVTADKHGIDVLQWFVLSMLAGCMACWFLLPAPAQGEGKLGEQEV